MRASAASSGGHTSSGSAHTLQGTLGQGIVGSSFSTGLTAHAGFWHQARPAAALKAPSAPVLLTPEDGDENLPLAVTLEWEAIAEASTYDVQVATTDDFATTVRDTTGVTMTTLDLEGLAEASTYFWRVRAVNGAGASSFAPPFRFSTTVDVATDAERVPDQFALAQNYPNPFNPSTTIVFELPAPSHVRLVIYDIYGRTVRTLVHERQAAGRYEVHFQAGDLASGIYLYRLDAGSFQATRSMLLVK